MLDFKYLCSKIEHMSDKWIRVSEIGDYVYCQRAWWLKRVRGHSSQNVRELAAGTAYHQQHGDMVRRSIWARRFAYAVLFIVVALLVFQIMITSL